MSMLVRNGILKILLSQLFMVLLGISGTGMVFADENGPLTWTPAEWGEPAFFSLGEEQTGPITGEDGLSGEFKQLLSTNPAALKAAEEAESSSTTIVAGWTILLAGTIVQLKDTMDQADDPLGTEPDSGNALGLVIVGAVVALVGTSSFKSHLNESVRIYNNGTQQGLRRPQTRQVNSPQFDLDLRSKTQLGNFSRNTDIGLLATMKINF